MSNVDQIVRRLEEIAPLAAAEDWDNVGLLAGDRAQRVERMMTCLTLTPATAAEAVAARVQLVVVHHPLPFRPLSSVTTDSTTGRLLWQLIGAGVSVYSAHTAFDSASLGINQQWAEGLGLREIAPLVAAGLTADANAGKGALGPGRCGVLPSPLPLAEFAGVVKAFHGLATVQIVGDDTQMVRRVAVACGSGGSLFDAALALGCDCFVTGETNFHTCLEAESRRVGLVLCGHYSSERFAMERLAGMLAESFPDIDVWASRDERDPLRAI